MDRMTENIPAFKVPSKLKSDLERLLKLKGYRRPDYLRQVLADAVRRDLATVDAGEGERNG